MFVTCFLYDQDTHTSIVCITICFPTNLVQGFLLLCISISMLEADYFPFDVYNLNINLVISFKM